MAGEQALQEARKIRNELWADMEELFHKRAKRHGYASARRRYVWDLILLLHPRLWRRAPILSQKSRYTRSDKFYKPDVQTTSIFHPIMIRSYLKLAARNLAKHKGYSLINIAGLAVGMAVAMLIGIWIQDEMSVNQHHQNYQTLYQVKLNQTFDGQRGTQDAIPFPLGEELRSKYPDFKAVAMFSRSGGSRSLIYGGQKFIKDGLFIFQALKAALVNPVKSLRSE